MANKQNKLVDALRKERKPASVALTPTTKKKALFIRLDPAARKQLDLIKVEQDASSLQSLMVEAINDLFLKYSKEPIA